MTRSFLAGLILAAAILPGCIAVGGTTNTPRATTGQELIDLKAALDRGKVSH